MGETPKKFKRPSTDLALIRSYLADGWEPDEIAIDAKMSVDRVRSLINQVYAEDGRTILGRTSETLYVDYVIRSRQNLRSLQDLRASLEGTNQAAAAVGAIKAQQDILDRIIKVGQDLGYVEKKPDRKEVLFGRLDDDQLNKRLQMEWELTRKMAVGFSNVSFLDVAPAPRMITSRTRPESPVSKIIEVEAEAVDAPEPVPAKPQTCDSRGQVVRKKAVLRS
jgi:hypothetical protein